MRPLSDTDWVRLVRYFDGELTPEEVAEVERWDPDQAGWSRTLAHLRQAWEARPKRFAGDSAALWQSLQRMIRGEEAGHLGTHTETPVRSRSSVGSAAVRRAVVPRWLWYAAAGVLIGAVGLVTGWQEHAAHSHLRTARSVSTYATTSGERATITLLDGTVVSLNVASRLDVPADYAAGNRTVRLTGEALFSVAHHEGAPFAVTSGGATARVLGTTFLVRRYPTDTTVAVAVRDGKVAVGRAVLTQGQLAEVSRTGVVHLGGAEPWRFSFANGVLTLPAMRLTQAIPELNRWYNADIRLGDSTLASREIRGEFTAGSLSDLSEVLEWTFDMHVVRNGRVLTLLPRVRR